MSSLTRHDPRLAAISRSDRWQRRSDVLKISIAFAVLIFINFGIMLLIYKGSILPTSSRTFSYGRSSSSAIWPDRPVINDGNATAKSTARVVSNTLHRMVFKGHLSSVRALLSSAQRDSLLESVDAAGRTALHIAVMMGHSQIVRELVDGQSACFRSKVAADVPTGWRVLVNVRTASARPKTLVVFLCE